MEHLVRFTTPEGRDAQHVSPSLEEALRFVERLRNNEEASVVRVFRLQEVPITFKAYYRAELRTAEPAEAVTEAPVPAAEAKPAAAAAPAAAPAAAKSGPPAPPAADVDSPEQQARKLFSRS